MYIHHYVLFQIEITPGSFLILPLLVAWGQPQLLLRVDLERKDNMPGAIALMQTAVDKDGDNALLRKELGDPGLKGRWQIIEKNPTIIADVAHNREGLVFTMNQIKTMDFHKLHIVLGVVNDKNLNTIIDAAT